MLENLGLKERKIVKIQKPLKQKRLNHDENNKKSFKECKLADYSFLFILSNLSFFLNRETTSQNNVMHDEFH